MKPTEKTINCQFTEEEIAEILNVMHEASSYFEGAAFDTALMKITNCSLFLKAKAKPDGERFTHPAEGDYYWEGGT